MDWNKCIYDDCLNENNGLPYLVRLVESGKMEKIDLCITDPPYNIDHGIAINFKDPDKYKREDTIKLYYDDMSFEEYKEFCTKWFNCIKKICNKIIFTCGKTNLRLWYSIDDFELLIWEIKNSSSRGFISKFIKFEPILCYGNFGKCRFTFDILDHYVSSGFLSEYKYYTIKHPHPKPISLYEEIIHTINPKSVIDPFLGSGVTSYVCSINNVKWIGYEINKEYESDINYRLKIADINNKYKKLEMDDIINMV